MNRANLIAAFLVAVSFLASFYYYPQLPDRVAVHWNAQGEADGYASKDIGLFIVPVITLLAALLFAAIPRIDPLRTNIRKFMKYYSGLAVLILVFLLLVHVQMILWGLGFTVSPAMTFPIGMGVLFYYIGAMSSHAKRNWFIGIRTPWTLSSDRVWNKTHKQGGKLFKLLGVISAVSVLFREYTLYIVLVPVFLVVAYLFAYSYFEYRKK